MLPPEERFTGLASVYDRNRPDYPDACLTFLEAYCQLKPDAIVVDIGSGTGISTRWLAKKGWNVIGIEPNDDMRRQAELGGLAHYRKATGEITGLPDDYADLILSAQAFHWLEASLALPEFRRVLKPGAGVALLWNERDSADPFTADYGGIIRRHPASVRTEDARQRAWQAFMATDLFEDKRRDHFAHQQAMDGEGLIGRTLSMSHTPKEGPAHTELLKRLRECFTKWQRGGQVVMQYVTSLFTGRKPS